MARRRRPDAWGLRNQVALVTGGTRGIGRAVAEALAAADCRLVVTSRRRRACERVAARLGRAHGVEALGVECDVSQARDVRRLFEAIRAWRKGPVRVLVNAAGHPVVGPWWETPLHRFPPPELERACAAVYAVDVRGSRLCTQAALKDMLRAGGGSIVYFSSTPALVGYQGVPYTEAKAALLGLMRDVARAYGPRGIRANAIAPGNIRTEWLARISAVERRALERENPLRRFGEPREAAAAALFLAGRLSSFVTGQVLVVDGGTVMR